MENLIVERDGPVAVVTINRPKTLNALNSPRSPSWKMCSPDSAKPDTDVRAVILTGAGEKSFVAGADIAEIRDLDMISGKDFAARGKRLYSMIEKLRVPVIAAVNGFALGGGCELAMSCHLRLASENAKFGQPEINLGIIPGYGGTQRLPRLVGRARALDLMLTGRMITAAEALQWGLVNAVVPQTELLPTARKLAAGSGRQTAARGGRHSGSGGCRSATRTGSRPCRLKRISSPMAAARRTRTKAHRRFSKSASRNSRDAEHFVSDLLIHNIGLLATPLDERSRGVAGSCSENSTAAILIRDGRIAAVGAESDVLAQTRRERGTF